MAAKPLLYVHRAGPQAPAAAIKHEADTIVFGRDLPGYLSVGIVRQTLVDAAG